MIELLLTYKYFIMILLAIVEGPIISVICGFFTTLGIFNIFLVFVVMVLGDIIGDAIFYFIGYSGERFLPYFKITDEKLEKAKNYYKNNYKKAIIVSKLVYSIGSLGLVGAGASRVSYLKYFKICAIFSLIQSTIMLTIGIFFGGAYVVIGKYLNYYAALVSVITSVTVIIIFIQSYKNKISKKINL
ncbi:hypothetical protein EXS45_00825 [Candidatus Nomurabacteria bacterium]|nr:hypothetical protein [Candidatus Nomurabacteria bacterium]